MTKGLHAFRRAMLLGTALAPIAGVPVLANPQGGQVVAGAASIAGGPAMVVQQSSNRAVINWQSFSIGSGEQVRFNLPSNAAAVLNRVTGRDPSALMGQLQSNGQVYLINPNGIVVGPGGRIETGGFVGSTLDLTNQAFMAGGPLAFLGPSTAGVSVLGRIRAATGDVVLVAASVANRGDIEAPAGQALLGAGQEVLYVPDGQSALVIRAPAAPPADGAAQVDNSGTIAAASVQLAAAGSPYALAVNNSGAVAATGMESRGGRLLLTAGDGDLVSGGSLAASLAGQGGSVALDGGRVAQTGRIDVSAPAGGGRVDIHAAEAATVTAGAAIDASATAAGQGGTVNVISAGAMDFAGHIAAKGGAGGGDGGFVEVSGRTLVVTGTVDVSAAAGLNGRLLLDPDDITIVSGSAAAPSGVSGGLWAFASDPGSQSISVGAIQTLLGSGNLELQANNSITVAASASLSSSSANTLTLNAPTIEVNGTISLSNGTLVFAATGGGSSLDSAASSAITADSLRVTGNYNTIALAGTVTTDGLEFTQDHGIITIDHASNAIRAVSVQAGAHLHDLTIDTATDLTVSGSFQGNEVTIAAGGNLTLQAGTVLDYDGAITLASTGGVLNNAAGPTLIPGGSNAIQRLYSFTDGTGFDEGGLGFTQVDGVAYPNTDSTPGHVLYIASPSGLPTITITADSFTRTYGQADPTFTASYSGGTAGDLTTAPQFRITQASHADAGTYTIQPYGAASSTNQIRYVTGRLTIEQAPLTVTPVYASMIYGGSLPSFSATASGYVNGDTSSILPSLTVAAEWAGSHPNAGNYDLTVTPFTLTNYRITYQTGRLFVARAPLTVTAEGVTGVYGAALPTPALSFSGFVNADDAASMPDRFILTLPAKGTGVGRYPITLHSPDPAPNYSVTFVSADATITPAPLVITPAASRLYGGVLPASLPASSYAGLVNGDTPASLTTQPTLATTATASSGVGSYALTASGAASANYQITYRTGTLTVTPAPLTVGVADATRSYGGADPTFTPTFSGLVNGDDASVVSGLTFSTAATRASDAGSYAVTAAGGAAANYAISYSAGRLAVTPVPLLLTPHGTMNYGGLARADVGYFASGFVNGDTVASLTVQPTWTSSANNRSGPGLYTLLASGAQSRNYTIRYQPGVMSLFPAELLVTPVSVSRQYGTATASVGLRYDGLANGESAADVFSTLPQANNGVSATPVGTHTIPVTPGTTRTANYLVSYGRGEMTVGPATLSVSTDNKAIYAGDALPAFVPRFSGLANGDTGDEYRLEVEAGAAGKAGVYQIRLTGTNPNYTVNYLPATLTVQQPEVIVIDVDEKLLDTKLDPSLFKDPNDTITVKTTLLFGFSGGAQRIEKQVIDLMLATMALKKPGFSEEELQTFIRGDRAVVMAALTPFMLFRVDQILAQDSAKWSADEGEFIMAFLDYINKQRAAGADAAIAAYDAWKVEQQQKFNAEQEKVQGVAQVYQSAILASDPTIPPPELLNFVKVGMSLEGDDLLMFAKIKDKGIALGEAMAKTSVDRANENLKFLKTQPMTDDNKRLLNNLGADLNSGDPAKVAQAEAIITRFYEGYKEIGLTPDGDGTNFGDYSGTASEIGRVAVALTYATGNGVSLDDIAGEKLQKVVKDDGVDLKNHIEEGRAKAQVKRDAKKLQEQQDLIDRLKTDLDKKNGDVADLKKSVSEAQKKYQDLESGGVDPGDVLEKNYKEAYAKWDKATDPIEKQNLKVEVDRLWEVNADAEKAYKEALVKAREGLNKAAKALESGEEAATTATKALTEASNAITDGAQNTAKVLAHTDDLVQTATDTALNTGKTIAKASMVGKILAVGGTLLEVVGNVVQIGMTSAAYASIATFNSDFDKSVKEAKTAMTVDGLKKMSKTELKTYMTAMMATGVGPGTKADVPFAYAN